MKKMKSAFGKICIAAACIVLCCFIAVKAKEIYLRHISVFPEMNEAEKSFVDLQKTQIRAAKKKGIEPVSTRTELKKQAPSMLSSGAVVSLQSGKLYRIQKLTHSHPYVIPAMETLLNDLGEAFQKESGSGSRFVITSVLRTTEDVAGLQKVNSIAVKNSAHQYGTTVDISYQSFDKDSMNPRTTEELRNALAKSLRQLQKKKRCYVKFERQSKCYHITVR